MCVGVCAGADRVNSISAIASVPVAKVPGGHFLGQNGTVRIGSRDGKPISRTVDSWTQYNTLTVKPT